MTACEAIRAVTSAKSPKLAKKLYDRHTHRASDSEPNEVGGHGRGVFDSLPCGYDRAHGTPGADDGGEAGVPCSHRWLCPRILDGRECGFCATLSDF
jgi:hypothetical protein